MGVLSGGYVEMQCAPYAYYHGAEAERENPKRGSLVRFSNPQIRRIAWSGNVGCKVLHLVYGGVRSTDPERENVLSRCEERGQHGYEIGQ